MADKRKERKKRGNPYLRGDTWTFYFFSIDKRQMYRGGFKSKKEAVKEMDRITSLVKLGLFNPNDRLKCSDYLVTWYEEHHRKLLSPSSQTAYTNALYNYIVPFMGQRKLQQITRTTVKALYKDVCSKSPSVAKIVKTIINQGFFAAMEEKLLLANPANEVNLPEPPAKRPHISFTDEQIETLFWASKDTPLHMAILLAITLGCRKTELYGLKYSDFDVNGKKVKIQRILARGIYSEEEYEERKANRTLTKAERLVKTENSDREIFVPDFVIAEVQKQKERYKALMNSLGNQDCDDGPVIFQRNGQPLSRGAQYNQFKRLLQDAGLPNIRWHDLRHINASFYYSKGVSAKAISKNLGHARDVVTVDKYIDTSPAERKAVDIASNFVDALFTPTLEPDQSGSGAQTSHRGLIAV